MGILLSRLRLENGHGLPIRSMDFNIHCSSVLAVVLLCVMTYCTLALTFNIL